VLAELDALGLAESTIVIFFSDNGPNTFRDEDRYTGGLRGRKGSSHEGGVRTPFFIRWQGRFQAGKKVMTVASHIDLFDTLLELTEVPEPVTLPRDGRSLVPLIEGRGEEWPDRMIFDAMGMGSPRHGAVRNQQYRWVMGPVSPGLYDIEADPGANNDLTEALPDVAAEFKAAFDEWAESVFIGFQSQPEFDRLPIPVGYAEAPVVTIPSTFCFLNGQGLKFSAAGWDWEWIENWTRTDQYVWWDIDVVRSGRYEVSIAYTCPASDLGSRMELRFGGSVVPFTVDVAAEPEEITFPDRFPRWECNDRNWGHMVLGTVGLEQGRTKLGISAVEIAGKSPFDLHTVHVRRVD
jgi:arylsulfatase A